METEHDDLVVIIAWLRRHPEEMAALRTCARLDIAPETIWPNVDDAAAAVRKYEAERYFQSGVFGWCAGCALPVVTFADGIRIEWAERERHHCTAASPRYRAVAV